MRKSPAEAAKTAVERLLKQRGKLQAQLDKVDAEIAEVHGALGVQAVVRPAPAPASAPPKPAMVGERAADSTEPKKSMGELMAEARKDPDQFKPGPRAPFIPPEERDGAPEKSLTTEGISPADSMGAGRYI